MSTIKKVWSHIEILGFDYVLLLLMCMAQIVVNTLRLLTPSAEPETATLSDEFFGLMFIGTLVYKVWRRSEYRHKNLIVAALLLEACWTMSTAMSGDHQDYWTRLMLDAAWIPCLIALRHGTAVSTQALPVESYEDWK